MPPKSQKSKDIMDCFNKSDNRHSNRSSTSTESAQPDRATGFQAGGATDCQPDGATTFQAGGATDCQPGGATDCQPGGDTDCQLGGAMDCEMPPKRQKLKDIRSNKSAATRTQVKKDDDCDYTNKRASDEKQQENPGTSSNPQQKSATRMNMSLKKEKSSTLPDGPAGSQAAQTQVERENDGDSTDNPHSNRSSTSTESAQPDRTTDCQPDGATDCQPDGATSFQAGAATDCQPDGATDCQAAQTQVKSENDGDSTAATETHVKRENDGNPTDGHSHHFFVKFSRTDCKKYHINCHQPRTVLEAIKSLEIYEKKMKCSDENVVIQLGKGDRKYIVATHFPCSLIEDGDCLIISYDPEQVEVAPPPKNKIYSRDKYSVFHIDTVGGENTITKQLFRNNSLRQFKYLCVYGEKGETVEKALKRDGRFIHLGKFTLSDNEDPNCITERSQKVDNLNGKQFKICLPRNERATDEYQQENPGTSSNPQQKSATRPVLDVAQQSGVSVRKAIKEMKESGRNVDTEEIYKILRELFPDLKELMQSRVPGDSYQKALKLKKENFGKIQQSFSEVHRVRKLLKLGESVCKVVVKGGLQGTGFVLFDNFILTNGHLFGNRVEEERLMEGTQVTVSFDDPEASTTTEYSSVKVADSYIYKNELDYAVFQLNLEGEKDETNKMKVPPGLLKNFCPLPEDGEACIIGHPAGGVKKMDPTCIIEKEKRNQAVCDHLDQYKKNTFTMHSIANVIKNQGIEKILTGGTIAEEITYNTFMYHGSSGSPVFDADGQVFGLHTAGFTYGFPNHTKSVIEFAQSVLTIFEHFVRKMKERRAEELLKSVEEEAKSNPFLKKILNRMATDSEEEMDID